MKMDRMVEYLENRGFTVEKRYIPHSKQYDFTIFKHGIETHGYFEYPVYAKDTPEMDKIQVNFLEGLIKDWESGKSKIDEYRGRDVDVTRNIYRNVVNSIYGAHSMRHVANTFMGLNEEQKTAVYHLVGKCLSEKPCVPKIDNVIFNNPATIVFWNDGSKTVVKCQEGDKFDPEKGLAMAISKKAMGNNYSSYNVFKKWLKKSFY